MLITLKMGFKIILRQFFFPRISYSVYELKKLRDTITADSLKVVLMYDIACILSSHLKVSTREMLLPLKCKNCGEFFFAFSITPPHPYPLPLGHFPFTPNCDWMHNKWTPSECLLHVLVCPGHMVGKVRYICIMLVSDVHTLYHSCLFRIVAKRSCYLV